MKKKPIAFLAPLLVIAGFIAVFDKVTALTMVDVVGSLLTRITKTPPSTVRDTLALAILTAVVMLGALAFEQSAQKKDQDAAGPMILGAVVVFVSMTGLSVLLHVVDGLVKRHLLVPSVPGIIAVPIVAAGLYAAIRCNITVTGRRSESILKGIEVVRNSSMALARFKKLAASSPPAGVAIHPELRMPLAQEAKHLLLISAPGGGKTQVMFPLLSDILKRGDPVILYDYKGDYTAALGEAKGTVIISPFDGRGTAWDVAADIDTEMRALEFARSLLPDAASKEPFFRRAAQDLLTGVIQRLQDEKSLTWTFSDLVEVLDSKTAIIDAVTKYRPAALQALGHVDSKQAASVLGELRAGTIQLTYLARAWSTAPTRLSLSKWVMGSAPTERPQLVIIKGNQEYRALDGFLTSRIFSVIIMKALSMSDSFERRLWAFLDEFGNIPRIEGIDTLLTAVRSKGLRVVCAVQDTAQIEVIYGAPFTQTFMGSFGTVLAGLTGGATAAYLSNNFGKNQIQRTLVTESVGTGGGKGGRGRSKSKGQTIVIENALLDETVARKLSYS